MTATADDRIALLSARRAALVERVQAMVATPEDQRPKGRTALRAWLADLESSQRLLEQTDKLVKTLEPKPQRVPKARPAPDPADESDVTVLARIPKGARAEMRVISKVWKGRRVIDVRCWAMSKETGEFGPTRKGVAVDARMLPSLLEALQLAQKHA